MDLQIYDPNQENRMTIFDPRPVYATPRPHRERLENLSDYDEKPSEESIYQSTRNDYQTNGFQWLSKNSMQHTMNRASSLYWESQQYVSEVMNVQREFSRDFLIDNRSDHIVSFIESNFLEGAFLKNPEFAKMQRRLQSMYDRVNNNFKMYQPFWKHLHDGRTNLKNIELLLTGLHNFSVTLKKRESQERNDLANQGYIIFPEDSLLGEEPTEYEMDHMNETLHQIYDALIKFDKLRRGIDDVPAYIVSGGIALFNPNFREMQQEMQSLYDKVFHRVNFQNDPTSPSHEAQWSKRDYHLMNNDLEHILRVRNLLQEKKNVRQKFLQERGCNITGE